MLGKRSPDDPSWLGRPRMSRQCRALWLLSFLLLTGCSYRSYISFLTALDILGEREEPYLGQVYPQAIRRAVTFPGGEGPLQADLYLRPGEGPRPGLLIIHGLSDMGKDDPRLVRLAFTLGRAGFAALVPDFPGLKEFRIRRGSVRAAVAAIRYLAREVPEVRGGDLGVLGISFGGGVALVAAAEEEVRQEVGYVVSFGGYFDLANVIHYYTTRWYSYEAEEGFGNPEPWAKWFLMVHNLDFVEDPLERPLFEKILRRKMRDEGSPVEAEVKALSPATQALYAVLANRDPKRFQALYSEVSPKVRGLVEDLSLGKTLQRVRADIILAHSVPDAFVPHTESLRLFDALRGRPNVSLTLLRTFQHVDPGEERSDRPLGLFGRLREGWKFYRLVDTLMVRAGM